MKKKLITGFLKLFIALLILWVAINIPSYFLSVDSAVLKVFKDSQTRESLASLYVSTGKLDSAKLIVDSTNFDKEEKASLESDIAQMIESKPLWKFTGARNSFFEENANILGLREIKEQSAYEFLASASNRNAVLEVLNNSDLKLTKDILALRNLNTTLLPPAFSSAGAPYSSAIIINAILVQNSSLNSEMLKDISSKIPLLASDSNLQKGFEEYCMGLLFFAKNMQFGSLSEMLSKANSMREISLLAKSFATQHDIPLNDLNSALLLYPNLDETINYLSSPEKAKFYIEASSYSQRAIEKLLSEKLAIYQSPSYVEIIPTPLEDSFASLSANSTKLAVFLKLCLIFLACFVFLSINIWRPDTLSWYSPLALIRRSLGAIVLASLVCLALEPDLFNFELAKENPVEIKLAIDNLSNLIGENNIMKFNMDTPTVLTLSLFLLMQFVIFASCLIKIATIKRMAISPSVKLELLNNEDNLFDLGLYVGLGGTVLSLIMLSLSMMNTALMAGYSSTLFGIMFTALLKIAFVRPYRHSLLLEVARIK
ncbi:MAG: hypothetical protein R3Y46_01970 [Opitutales bacterium]